MSVLILYTILFACCFVLILTKGKFFEENLFVNWTTFGYFYDIASFICMAIILIGVNVFPSLGRKARWLLLGIYYITFLYVTMLFFNYSFKTYVLWDKATLMVYSAAFALYFGIEYMYRDAFIVRLLYLLNMFAASVIFLFISYDFFLILIA